ncbi:hypothetical protein FRC02_008955 [Tulasnella sp. 418]|nr:hypothetical protein FRC02_008955 [Tulasnella sp. 418]
MGDRCEYDVKPTVPKATELAALEDRLQFVEKLLSAQALYLAPFLANIQFNGQLPTIRHGACDIDGPAGSSSGASTNDSIRAIKRTVGSGGKSQTPSGGPVDTPSALATFYLDIGNRLLRGDRKLSTTIPVRPVGSSASLGSVQCTPQPNTTPMDGQSIKPSETLKRKFQAAELIDLGEHAPAVSPPWISTTDMTGAERSGQNIMSPAELVGGDLMDDIIHEYFLQYHPFLPVLHRPSFLNDIRQASKRPSLLPVLHSMVSVILPRAIVPMGPNFTRFPGALSTPEGREKLANIARKKVMLLAVDRPSVESLQALLILAVDALGTRVLSRGCTIIGMLCRMSVQCQINREFISPANQNLPSQGSPIREEWNPTPSVLPVSLLRPPNNWVEAETRRRIFWAIVYLDRLTSAGTGFHVALNRRDMLCLLPASDQDYENGKEVPSRYTSPLSPFRFRPHPAPLEENEDAMDVSLSTLGCLVEAGECLGSVQHFMMEAGNWNRKQQLIACQELDSKLRAWRLNLPPEVQTLKKSGNEIPDPLVVMVHATFNASVILLNQTFAYPAPAQSSATPIMFNPSKGSLSRCMATTKEMTDLIQFVGPHMTSMNPLLAFCLFVSARAILVHIKHCQLALPGLGNQRPPSVDSKEFDLHIRALRSISQRWQLGARFAEALEKAHNANAPQVTPLTTSFNDPTLSSDAGGLLDLRLSAFNQAVSGSQGPGSGDEGSRKGAINVGSHNNDSLQNSGRLLQEQPWNPALFNLEIEVDSQQPSRHENSHRRAGSLPYGRDNGITLPQPDTRSRSSSFHGLTNKMVPMSSGTSTATYIQPTFSATSSYGDHGSVSIPMGMSIDDPTSSTNLSGDGMFTFGFEAYGLPGEEYGGPAIDWSIFERLLS